MPWEKSKNVFSTDAADAAAEKAIQESNMVGSVWGKSTPASSKEDGLYQRMVLDQIRTLIRRLGQSGWTSRSALSFSGGFPANSFRFAKGAAYVDGLPITEVGSNLNSTTESQVTLAAPPGGGTRDDLVFLEVWLAEVPGSTASAPVSTNKPSTSAVYRHGNVLYGGTNPVDDINEVNFEIRRRVQAQYRVRAVSGINFLTYTKGVNDPTVLAQGPLGAPSALAYAAVSDDAGLFRAGNGSAAHQTSLGTLDGFVYAIPMFKVARTAGDTTVDSGEVTDLRDFWGGSPAAHELFTTGDVKLTMKTAADAGWILMNDTTIGNAASGATGWANADTLPLYTLIWNNINDTWAPVIGGRGVSAAADFAANKQLALPKTLGRALAGYGTGTVRQDGVDGGVDLGNDEFVVVANNNMWVTGMPVVFSLASGTITGLTSGNTYYVIRSANNRIKLASSLANAQNGIAIDLTAKSTPVWSIVHTFTARALGEAVGEVAHAMSSTELLAHTHTIDGAFANGTSDGPTVPRASYQSVQSASTGGNAAMNIMQPTVFFNVMVKL
jgi:hypothetical protein